MSTPDPGSVPAAKLTPPAFSLWNVLSLTLPFAIILGLVYGWMYLAAQGANKPVPYRTLIRYSMVAPTKLEEGYTDADGDLVADAPTDKAKQVNPDPLLFATLGPNLESEQAEWKEFVAHLAKVTGKKVEHVARPDGIAGAVTNLKEGTIHVLALTTGQVPTAVNRAGFVPCCVMAADDGTFGYEMEIIVPTDSPVQNPSELRDRLVALGSMGSNSSFKAPAVLLWKEFKLVLDRDFRIVQSIGPEQAVEGVCTGRYEAAPMANDLLKRIVSRRKEKAAENKDVTAFAGRYRSIYKSKKYPPACFGYVYNLNPDTAKKVREAYLNFDWKGTKLEAAYRAANQSKFVPISYKEHWEVVRENDEAMNQLLQTVP